GKLDVVITNFFNKNISILLGHGDGSFSQAQNSPIHIGDRPTSVAVGDFNQDGNLDIAVSNAEDNNVVILLGHGDGTFSSAPYCPISTGLRPVAVAVADFNGDGKPDLAIATLLSSQVSVYLGDGTGKFQLGSQFTTGRYPSALAVGDFDNDEKLDIAV